MWASVFIAEHKDRFSCGKCGYTEFKSSVKKEIKMKKHRNCHKPKTRKKKEEKLVEKLKAVQNNKK